MLSEEDGSVRKDVLPLPKKFKHVLLSAVCMTFLAQAHAAGVPDGFVDKGIYSGFVSPSALTALPDGRVLVVQQDGVVRIVKDDTVLPAVFYQVPNVDNYWETGCVGITIDPNFMSNGYVYMYCTMKNGVQSYNRVLRITAAGDTAVPGSEVTLLNLPVILPDPVDGSKIYTHIGGAMRFGNDGKLYVAVGGHENSKIDPPQNSYSQKLDTPFGKLLRINPDGSFPADNPFYNTPGAYKGIYSLGLRNPFGMDIQSDTGTLFINDTGSGKAEEINRAQAGANYGWPRYEGVEPAAGYTDPVYNYPHGVDGNGKLRCAITGGSFYTPPTSQFPGEYNGKYLFTDYCSGSIYTLDPDNPASDTEFVTDIASPVGLTVGADGSLYYLARNTNGEDNIGFLGKVEYNGSHGPRISKQPRNQTIYIGDPVTFTVQVINASSIQWQRNGVDIPGATSASYTLNSTTDADTGALFTAVTQNALGTTVSSAAKLTITHDHLPVADITSPGTSHEYAKGDKLTYSGTATDAEDGTLPASSFTWRGNFHHDTHVHPFFAPTSGAKEGTVTIPDFEGDVANTWIELILDVKDSAGQTQTFTREIYPRHQVSSLRPMGSPTNGLGPIETDRNNGGAAPKDGGPISIANIPFPKGLGVYAPSNIAYKLGGMCAGSLIADVGIDDSVGDNGSVVFQVLLDGQVAYDSGLVRGSDQRKSINLDVTGKQEMRLVVTDGGDGNNLDLADWGAPRLTCESLPEETLPAANSDGGSGGGGGCSIGGTGKFDPTLAGLTLAALGIIAWRRKRKAKAVTQ